MCVCRGCFIHIDKCPVCRAPFNTYVVIQDNTDPQRPSTSLEERLGEEEN